MKKIRLQNKHNDKKNYLDLVHFCDTNDAVPEEFDCPSIRFPPPKSIYYPFDYKILNNFLEKYKI